MDRDEVIKELTNLPTTIYDGFYQLRITHDLRNKVIAMLKEQEAVKPKKESNGNPEMWASWWYVCGNCGMVIDYHDMYCRHCGRAVKWD